MSTSPVDLCIALFRVPSNFGAGSADELTSELVQLSKRQINGSVGFNEILKPGIYIALPLAFNHWQGNGGKF